ncbi:hypothetical protein EBAPG3_005870 [Nitrosospira lacus]|uniref:Uncharacterized protein n=1 Tax=Nitrosospira lacus TaxID=1288494 RepID=A0A1W6SNF8_9PROT|nr:hypothetical protein [Nitrosospira lacus]ARO87335.1 hypothetical protein EBAPG3_005870 [Nitrosospira lacus]
MDKPQPISSHHRLQELLAIPERQRTEAQWDEINELEITLTPVNRALSPERGNRRTAVVPSDPLKSRNDTQSKRPLKKLRKRQPKGGGAGGGVP